MEGGRGPNVRREGAGPVIPPVLLVSRIGPHGSRVPHPGASFKPPWGDWGNAAIPSRWKPPKVTVNHMHSHPWPRPGLVNMKTDKQQSKWEVTTDIPFLNQDPITHLVGQSNEAPVIVNWQEAIALIDLGVQVSSISLQESQWFASLNLKSRY